MVTSLIISIFDINSAKGELVENQTVSSYIFFSSFIVSSTISMIEGHYSRGNGLKIIGSVLYRVSVRRISLLYHRNSFSYCDWIVHLGFRISDIRLDCDRRGLVWLYILDFGRFGSEATEQATDRCHRHTLWLVALSKRSDEQNAHRFHS